MATGTRTYKSMAVPLSGESEIMQETVGNDILTLTRMTAGTGDFMVFRDNSKTEVLAVDKRGFLKWPGVTTAPVTGLTKGDLFLLWSANTAPCLGVCVSTATNDVKYISPFDTETAGRAT